MFGQPQGRTVLDAGRHLDGEGGLLHAPPFAAAVGTGARDHFTGAATTRAGDARHHLTEQRLTHPAQFTGPFAVDTHDGLGARGCAAAPAGGTRHGQPDRELLAAPEDGFGELEAETDLCVRPGLGASPAGAHPRHLTEERLEDVAQPCLEAETSRTGLRAEDALGPVPVVAGASLGITEHFVGHGHLLEARLGLGVAVIGIGVQLAGPGPVRALDLLVAGVAPHPEQLVEVADLVSDGHRAPPPDAGPAAHPPRAPPPRCADSPSGSAPTGRRRPDPPPRP